VIGALALVLLAQAAGADEKAVRLPGGEHAWVAAHRLELRRGKAKAALALPPDATGIARVSAGPPLTLTLERVCPPNLTLTLSQAELDARFALAAAEGEARKGGRADAAKQLGRALAGAPRDVELRLALARLQLGAAAEADAVETLRGGLAARGPEVLWAVLEDAQLRPLAGRLGLPARPAGLVSGSEPPASLAAWSPDRRWFVSGRDGGRVQFVDDAGHDVSSLALLSGDDFDASGDVSEAAHPRLQRRVADLDRLLGAFGFRAFDRAGAGKQEVRDDLTWLRWKDRGLVASAGGTSLRVRRNGQVVFEKAVETMGTIGLRWGQLLADPSLLVLSWERRSGNDECPNGDGLEVVKLAGTPGR
jgi:hypothetical protein